MKWVFLCFCFGVAMMQSLHYGCEERRINPIELFAQVKNNDQELSSMEIQQIQTNAWQPLRITFDTRYLQQDGSYICKFIGQMYQVGTPSSSSVRCEGSIQNNCYGTCTNDLIVSDNFIQLLNNTILPNLVSEFSKLLQVIRDPSDKIQFSSSATLCNDVSIPLDHKLYGINQTDVVIYISARPILSGAAAYAAPCALGNSFTRGRPVAGNLNINPLLSSFSNEKISSIVMHESVHVLGFTRDLFPFYKDSAGQIRPQSQTFVEILKSHTTSSGQVHSQTNIRLISPASVREIRNHLNCSTLQGLDLEDFSSSGTYGSHIEPLLAINELMISNIGYFNPSLTFSFSRLTMAVLEDSGYYQPNYTRAHDLIWGKNMGCNFVQRCENWNTKKQGYFCSQNMESGCTHDLRSKGFCYMREFSNDLGYNEHFPSNPKLGGADAFLNHCPLYFRYPNAFCDNDQISSVYIYPGEAYGSNSACFDANIVPWFDLIQRGKETRCLQYKCSANTTLLSIRVDAVWYNCPLDQSEVVYTLSSPFRGTLKCPQNGWDILCNPSIKDFYKRPIGVDQGTLVSVATLATAMPLLLGIILSVFL